MKQSVSNELSHVMQGLFVPFSLSLFYHVVHTVLYHMMFLRNLSHDIKTLAAVVQIFNPGLNQILRKVF